MQKGKGIVLYSGGLDSLLTAKILLNQGIDVIGFHCILPFVPPDADLHNLKAVKLAEQINLNLVFYRCSADYINMVKNPAHGYGKHMNPCIDCKIFFLKKAAEYMYEINADFVATGEVVGQRPMSQLKHTLNHIEKVTDLKGRLVRPLSAKILNPTIPEIEGIINRDTLYDISGRSRSRQMELAKEFGIQEYSSPAGGCLFTDKFISQRLKDLFDYNTAYDQIDIYLLTIGRHFRINDKVKIIVSKNESENDELKKYSSIADYFLIPEFKGPSVLVKGELHERDMDIINTIISRYGRPENNFDKITVMQNNVIIQKISVLNPMSDDELNKIRI